MQPTKIEASVKLTTISVKSQKIYGMQLVDIKLLDESLKMVEVCVT